ncbi:MAG: hypothetical protein A3J76_04640 [Candidatus Moranbacteria bacterium RBG_13_45_13]|nr:MAG: hypothetical protein A3J76_04640 [Candidatus Moranbacteria bacterium RBG_13_45_13]
MKFKKIKCAIEVERWEDIVDIEILKNQRPVFWTISLGKINVVNKNITLSEKSVLQKLWEDFLKLELTELKINFGVIKVTFKRK